MKESVANEVNSQINAEFESAYVYLAMSARMEEMKLTGLAKWLRLQWEEELVHALKLYDFLIQRDVHVELYAIKEPSVEFSTPLGAFQLVLEHEQYITKRINDLFALATEEKDYALQSLLKWYIDEQVEEEDNARSAIDALELVGNGGSGLFLFDREMGQRQPEPEGAP